MLLSKLTSIKTLMTKDYLIHRDPSGVDAVQTLENKLFKMDSFHFESDLLRYPFQKTFHHHYFLDLNHMFTEQEDYTALIQFLMSIKSESFLLSAPYYAVLYPVEISVNCPYNVYRYIPSYAIPEMREYPQYGIGFAGVSQRFMFDRTGNWALFYEDSYQYITIGVEDTVKDNFINSFRDFGLLNNIQVLDLIERYGGASLDTDIRDAFVYLYPNNTN